MAGEKTVRTSERVSKVSYAIRDIVAVADKVKARGVKIISLNIGDPNKFDFRPPQHVLDAVAAVVKAGEFTGYAPSHGDPELRKLVAAREGVEASDVYITCGLSEGIGFLFEALIDPGDNVLLPSPSYPLYTTKSRALGGADNFYLCDENWNPDVEDIRKKINERTKAIVVINPDNPTGAFYPEKILKEIVNIAGEFGIPIIADEIYDKLVLEGKPINIFTIAKDVPVISANGISKVYCYPGARVGFLTFHGKELEALNSAVGRLCNARLSINWEMQRGAIAALTGPQDHIKGTVEKIRSRRDIVLKRFREMDSISCVPPRGTFYMFPKIEAGPWKNDKDFVISLVEETGVLVVQGSGFSPLLNGLYFRMVCLPEPPLLNEALDKIENFMKGK